MQKIMIMLLPISLFVGIVNAQNARERIQNTVQRSEGRQQLERDVQELKNFSATLNSLNNAFERKDAEAARQIKSQLIQEMVREIGQSAEKAKQARRELAQSSQEIRSDRRELKRDRKDSQNSKYDRRDDKKDMARDKANMRDDRRDRRDDKRDLEDRIRRAERQAEILKRVKIIEFSFAENLIGNSIKQKLMINEFKDTMAADIAATKRELEEDIKESREDRRESRDDREERNEPENKRRRR